MRTAHTASLMLAALGIGAVWISPARAQSTLYGLSSAGFGGVTTPELYTLSLATGAAAPLVSVAPAETSLVGLGFLGSTLFASDVVPPGGGSFSFGTIDTTTGAFTALSDQGGAANIAALAPDPTANLFYTVNSDNSSDIFETIAPDGTVTAIGPTGLSDYVGGVAYDAASGTVYAETAPGNLYTINKTTGVATFVGSSGVIVNSNSDIAVDPDNGQLYLNIASGAGNGVQEGLYSLDKSNGALAFIGANGPTPDNGIDGIAFGPSPPAVPEASTTVSLGLLLALGMGGIIVAAKRKKAASAL